MNLTIIVVLCILAVVTQASNVATIHNNALGFTSRSSPITCEAALGECLENLDNGKQCEILPVPPRSLLPFTPPGTFRLRKLREGVWLFNDGAYLSLILRRGRRLALIDFPETPATNTTGIGQLLLDAVDQVVGNARVFRIDMIYSHAHFDHIGSSKRFYDFARKRYPTAKIIVWGTKETRELIRESGTERAVQPTRILTGDAELKVGDVVVKLEIVGGHTQEDMLIYIPRYKNEKSIAYFVDIAFPRWSMPFNLAITQDVRGLIQAHKALLKLEFDVYVGGHLRAGNRKDVTTGLEYLQDVVSIGAELLNSATPQELGKIGLGRLGDRNAREFGNAFFAFRASRDLEVDKCYRALIEKWGCRLAALDQFLRGHCLVALLYTLTSV